MQSSDDAARSPQEEEFVIADVLPPNELQSRSPDGEAVLGRLHPTSIFFEAAAQVRQYFFPVLLALAGAASGNAWTLWLAVPTLVISLIVNAVRYFTLRYQLDGDDLVVKEGLLFRRVRSVPVRRIQNIDLVQNLLHRMFDVAVVNIETASGDKPEATLRVIKLEQVQQLRAAVFREADLQEAGSAARVVSENQSPDEVAVENTLTTADPSEQLVGDGAPTNGELLWSASPKHLLLAGLASNRGLVLLGVVAGLFFQGDWTDRDWYRGAAYRNAKGQISSWLPEWFWELGTPLQMLLAAAVILLVLRVVSVVWFFLTFHDYSLTRHGEDLRISCGLFTRVSATVPRKRIQFVSIHSPLLLRPLGLAAVRIETAGGGGGNEDASTTVSRRWFIPVIPYDRAVELLPSLRSSIDWQPEHVPWQSLSPQTSARLTRGAVIVSLLVCVAGLLITRPWGWVAGPLAAPALVWYARKKARARRYARLDWGIVYQSGVLNRKLSFTFSDRLQVVRCSQGWFDRRWGMSTLSLDTAAAGPAGHRIEVPYLDAKFAASELRRLNADAARFRPDFG